METSRPPLTKRQLSQLQGYVAWTTVLGRAAVFVVALAAASWLLRRGLTFLWPDGHWQSWWMATTAALGVALYILGRMATGGPAFHRRVRADLAGGVAAVHRVFAVEAIEVEPAGDEGPAYFILTSDGQTMLFAGQYLEREKQRGFPWKEFDIVEAPESKVFFGLTRRGESLVPSLVRKPFTWEESKKFRKGVRYYGLPDAPFEGLKRTFKTAP